MEWNNLFEYLLWALFLMVTVFVLSRVFRSGYFRWKWDLGEIDDGAICYEGRANHFLGMEAAGGRMIMLKDRLIFKSHRLNFRPHETMIPLEDITSVSSYRILGIIPTGLKIGLADGQTAKFAVERPAQWQAMIKRQKKVLTVD